MIKRFYLESIIINIKSSYSLSHKDVMSKASGKNDLPQLFVDGAFKGLCEDLENANEDGAVLQFLGL